MKARHQSDGNAAEIIAALRAAGCSVQIIQGANGQRGVPDLLVGVRGVNYLREIKLPKGRLDDEQCAWHLLWRGEVQVVRTVDDALRSVGLHPASPGVAVKSGIHEGDRR